MIRNLKGVLIDLDNTLYDYAPCNEHAIKTTVKFLSNYYGITYTGALKLFLNSRHKVKERLSNNASSHSRLLYLKEFVENLERKTNPPLVLKLEKLFWQSYFKKMRLRKNAKKFLKQCQAQKLKTVIVTNLTAQVQLEKVVKLKVDKLIDFVITSEEAGMEKPDPKMIEFALKSSGLEKSNVLFVGDSDDLNACEKAKIRFIMVNNDQDFGKAIQNIKNI